MVPIKILKKHTVFLMGFFFALFLLLIPKDNFAQIDTSEYYDDESDLFDSTANYREMYKDLDKDGEWIKTTKGELEDMIPKDEEEVSSGESCCRNQIIWVWRPRVYYVGWSPYCYGRWYYTIWGWFWYSFYDWGWACYHHGRWVYSEIYGWIWIPGRVWAPSWVDWCYTGAYVGWFPRYPHFNRWHKHRYHYHHHHYYKYWTFIEKKKFTKELITKENIIDADYNQLLISKSNIGKESKYNDIIINNGPPVKNIEKSIDEKIEPKLIKYTEKEKSIKIDDNSITIYKPKEAIVKETGSKNNKSTNTEKKKDYNDRDTESKNVEKPNKEKKYESGNQEKEKIPYEYKKEESKSYENKQEKNKSYENKRQENKSYENKQRESKPRDENRNYNSGERNSKENKSNRENNNNNSNRNNNSGNKNENKTNSRHD